MRMIPAVKLGDGRTVFSIDIENRELALVFSNLSNDRKPFALVGENEAADAVPYFALLFTEKKSIRNFLIAVKVSLEKWEAENDGIK